jgi:prevent-host-death family protein
MRSPTISSRATGRRAGDGSPAGLSGAVRRRGAGAELASLTLSIADAKRGLSELCARAEYARETIVVTKHGRPVAAIVSIEDIERLAALEDQCAVEILERAIATSAGATEVMPREAGAAGA